MPGTRVTRRAVVALGVLTSLACHSPAGSVQRPAGQVLGPQDSSAHLGTSDLPGNDSVFRVVIRSPTEWRAFMARYQPGVWTAAVPPVDLTTEMLLLVADGPSSGLSSLVRIEQVTRRQDTLIAEVVSGRRACIDVAAIVYPIDAVRLPLDSAPVRFVERRLPDPCRQEDRGDGRGAS